MSRHVITYRWRSLWGPDAVPSLSTAGRYRKVSKGIAPLNTPRSWWWT